MDLELSPHRILPLRLRELKINYELPPEDPEIFHPNTHCHYVSVIKLGLNHSKPQKFCLLAPVISKFHYRLRRLVQTLPKSSFTRFEYLEYEETRDFWMLFGRIFPPKFTFFVPILRSMHRVSHLRLLYHTSINDSILIMMIKSVQRLKFLKKLQFHVDFWTDPIQITDKSLRAISKSFSRLPKLDMLDLGVSRHDFTNKGFSLFCKDLIRLQDIKVLKLKFYRFLDFIYDQQNVLANDKYATDVLTDLAHSLSHLSKLQSLKINHIPISGCAVSSICKAIPTKLKSLSMLMSNSWMDDKGVESLRDTLSDLVELRQLKLNLRFAYPVSSEVISSLVGSGCMARLMSFKFDISLNNNIKDQQLIDLSLTMTKMSNLRDLSMRFSYLKFSESAFKDFFIALAYLFGLEKLKLIIDHTEVNDVGMLALNRALIGMKKLRSFMLNMSCTHVRIMAIGLGDDFGPMLEDIELHMSDLSLNKSYLWELITVVSKKPNLQKFTLVLGRRDDKSSLQEYLTNRLAKKVVQFQIL